MDEFEFVVVGSGVGLNVLSTAINSGMECALIENTKIGGTCLTRGCIPSKVLVYPADVIRNMQHAKKVGVQFSLDKIDWSLISDRMWKQIEEGKQIEKSLKTVPNLKLFKGVGEFTGEYEMKVISNKGSKELGHFKAKQILLASGARTAIPPVKGLDTIDYITNESFFGEKFPKKPYNSLTIIGGGVFAVEFAHIFSAMGTEVTIIEMLPRLVSTEEPEISDFLSINFKKNMNVLLNKKAVKVEEKKGKKKIIVEDTNTGERDEVIGDEILIAAGRKSNADLLKVERTDIEIDERGWIKTNQFLETTKKNIWCIGDANGKYQFRHTGNYEAEIVENNIFGDKKREVDYSAVPWAIFTYPQIGHVGMTQQEAIDKGHKIYVAKKHYSSIAKGFAMGFKEDEDDDGFFKLVVDQSFKILGAHIVGPEAAVLVQPFVYLMNSGYTCNLPEEEGFPSAKLKFACPEAGSFIPIYQSQIIHPSLNEVTGWAIGNLEPVNIEHHHHHHHS